MDSSPQVVDYKRRARLYPDVKPWFEANTNSICLLVMLIGFCMAWMRAVHIKGQKKGHS